MEIASGGTTSMANVSKASSTVEIKQKKRVGFAQEKLSMSGTERSIVRTRPILSDEHE
jgi:hypothetical protein